MGFLSFMAAINNAAISIHRILSNPDIPLRAAVDHIPWRPGDRIS